MQTQKLVDDTRASMVEWQAKLVKLADGAHPPSSSLFPPLSLCQSLPQSCSPASPLPPFHSLCDGVVYGRKRQGCVRLLGKRGTRAK
jgi:hypothetical protein